jgi:hypothetical protein
MTRNKEGLDINAYCYEATNFSFEWGAPVTKTGKPYRIGYRICGNADCMNKAHITQSPYMAKKHLGYLPNLKRRYEVIPAEPADLIKIAERATIHSRPKTCQVNTCTKPHKQLGLCKAHVGQFAKWREANPSYRLKRFTAADINQYVQPNKGWDMKVCDRYCHVPDCKNDYWARGLCAKHYDRWRHWKEEK